jgi:hypothetical protein
MVEWLEGKSPALETEEGRDEKRREEGESKICEGDQQARDGYTWTNFAHGLDHDLIYI